MYKVRIHHVCRGIGRHVNYGSFLRLTWKVNVTINEIFYHSMLTGTKHVANNSYIFSAGQRTGALCMQHSPTAG